MAALNKHWQKVTVKEYLHEWDIPQTEAACRYAGFSKEVVDSIWIPDRKPGVYDVKTIRRRRV